jgi:hypothetical protein
MNQKDQKNGAIEFNIPLTPDQIKHFEMEVQNRGLDIDEAWELTRLHIMRLFDNIEYNAELFLDESNLEEAQDRLLNY